MSWSFIEFKLPSGPHSFAPNAYEIVLRQNPLSPKTTILPLKTLTFNDPIIDIDIVSYKRSVCVFWTSNRYNDSEELTEEERMPGRTLRYWLEGTTPSSFIGSGFFAKNLEGDIETIYRIWGIRMKEDNTVTFMSENTEHVTSLYKFNCDKNDSLEKINTFSKYEMVRPKITVFPNFFIITYIDHGQGYLKWEGFNYHNDILSPSQFSFD